MTPAELVEWGRSPAGGAVAAIVGLLLGAVMTRAVAAWFRATDARPISQRTGLFATGVMAAATVALWWWEVRLGSQLPHTFHPLGGGEPLADLWPRWLAHAVLVALLAAATWIDLEQRVIPDWITLPGVLAGLAAVWAVPQVLLPIGVEVPRSFAAPTIEADVLAWFGGLMQFGGLTTSGRGPFGPAPHPAGLGLAAALFTGWWFVCTAPGEAEAGPLWRAPRTLLLAAGLAAVCAAWWAGGSRFDALQSGLVGLAVSGGLVWAVRAGASAALGREAMGLGDVTLMAMIGAWLGWQACVLTFFLAAFVGLAHGVVQVVRHRESELPFGPSLCLAAVGVLVAWRGLWQGVQVYFEEPGQLAAVVATVVGLTAATLFGWRLIRPAG